MPIKDLEKDDVQDSPSYKRITSLVSSLSKDELKKLLARLGPRGKQIAERAKKTSDKKKLDKATDRASQEAELGLKRGK
jgi:hypothetical protein